MAGADSPPADGPPRCGFVAVIGPPNVGKSTLVNRLVGAKVSIVSPKVQTTRCRVRGIFLHGAAQVVLTDTPGIFRPKRRLDEAMVDTAWASAHDADLVLLIVDIRRGVDDEAVAIAGNLAMGSTRRLVLNKSDLAGEPPDRPALQTLARRAGATEAFAVSARTGDGVDALAGHLADAMPEGPWLYPEDQLSDLPLRLFAAELTREQAFRQLDQELPYAVAVVTESWRELPDGATVVEQVIFVQRDSQKAIVVGRGGRRIKALREAAQRELADALERPVHLYLFVKVEEAWDRDPQRYAEWGMPFRRG